MIIPAATPDSVQTGTSFPSKNKTYMRIANEKQNITGTNPKNAPSVKDSNILNDLDIQLLHLAKYILHRASGIRNQ